MSSRAITRTYSEEQISDGLTALALYNGSATAAARELQRQGRPIPKTTLKRWKTTHAERYEDVRRQVRERVYARVSDVWRDAAEEGGHATLEALAKGREAADGGDPKAANSWASTARNFATAGAISQDKASVIDGRPTEIRRDTPDIGHLLRELERRFPEVVTIAPALESTAEEIEPEGESGRR